MRFAGFVLFCVSLCAQQIPAAYGKYCAACHADSATGTDRGPGLIDTRSLRARSQTQIRDIIRNGTRGGMPAFPLADAELDELARSVHSWNVSAFDANPAGDAAAEAKPGASARRGSARAAGTPPG